ncbi:MAG: C39 family peptidase [Candidatus Babeliales bacterium]|jgi:hypothetical protein
MEYKTHFLWVVTIACCLCALLETPLEAKRRIPWRRACPFRHYEIPSTPVQPFSKPLSKFFDESSFPGSSQRDPYEYVWEVDKTKPFNELIFSWNALRPEKGKITFLVSTNYPQTSGWHRIAEWGPDYQRTFTNKHHPYVHTKHVRVEMQKHKLATGFRVKVIFSDGAPPHNLRALFACISDTKLFKISLPNINSLKNIPPLSVPKQSQMVIDHPRAHDLCSPTSTSMLVNYFTNKMYHRHIRENMQDYVADFADKVHDDGNLNIYGNWILNVAQAFDSANGGVFFRVERLNNFASLHDYLTKRIPVAVSVRRLRGGAMPYRNGHFMVVVGWDSVKRMVTCIDPAFGSNGTTLRHYKLRDFLQAWGRSLNLSYIPIPSRQVWNTLWA